MQNLTSTNTQGIKKLHLSETVAFANSYIPGIDQSTLDKLVELVNANGAHGCINQVQLIQKMQMILKYIPGTCVHTLLVLVDLLEISLAVPQLAAHDDRLPVLSNERFTLTIPASDYQPSVEYS